MKTTRGIIGLFRATCEALESAVRGVEGGIAFNSYSWVGGPTEEVKDVDVPVVRLVADGDHVTVTMSDVLSYDEAREIHDQLQGHAVTHGVSLTVA